MLEPLVNEFARYRVIAEKALAQVPDDVLNQVPVADGNSMAMLVRHLSGNLVSRFTDFLASDGEKPWRNRDAEFEERFYSRSEVDHMWQQGWSLLERTLSELSDADLATTVRIRGLELTVQAALVRSVAHVAYHVGQIVLLARNSKEETWEWISIPKGDSVEYNKNPTKERGSR